MNLRKRSTASNITPLEEVERLFTEQSKIDDKIISLCASELRAILTPYTINIFKIPIIDKVYIRFGNERVAIYLITSERVNFSRNTMHGWMIDRENVSSCEQLKDTGVVTFVTDLAEFVYKLRMPMFRKCRTFKYIELITRETIKEDALKLRKGGSD